MVIPAFSSFSPSLFSRLSATTRHQRLTHVAIFEHIPRQKQSSSFIVSINILPSSSSSMIFKNPTPPAQRRFAQYHPTIWGPKLIDSFTTHYSYELHEMRLESLKKKVASALLAASAITKDDNTSTWSILKLIDSIQRLGVAYHFEKEIEAALSSLASSSSDTATSNLHTVALKFRILRQHGISISPDVFNKFRSGDGDFKDDLSTDVEGLLSLYEASHLEMLGEDDVPEEAKSFSIKNLKQYLRANSEDENDDDLLKQLVQQSLETPLHWRMPRIEARNSIEMYQRDNSRNLALLELAKLDYNLVQSIYQREIKELSRWWKELDFKEKAKFSRDRLMENYLWAMGINYEPQLSECRIGLTKFVCILSAIDDMYDVYGFLDELECFTHAVSRWNMEAKEELADYMKPIYVAMLTFGNELADNVLKNNGVNALSSIKKEWENLCKSYLVEARWFYSNYTPTLQEYLENSWTSVGGPGAIQHAYLLQGCRHLTRSSHESFKNGSQIIYWASLMTRLSDDLGTSKAERERGDVAKAVECYMEEEGVSEEEAQDYIKDLICCCWKKMNEEMMSSKNSNIPKSVVKMSLNMARSAHSIFQHGDGIGTSIGVTKDRLISLIANPIPIDPQIHLIISD